MPNPLGPESLAWQRGGDWRTVLMSLWAGSMQNMHPQLGAGVEEHSRFFEERWQRLFRSIYPILGSIYDGDRAPQTARQVRDYHCTIKGIDRRGHRYSALNPDTFFWAHCTFVLVPILTHEYFGRPYTRAEKERAWQEGLQWWALYGISKHDIPPDWAAFERYWDHMCAHVLEDNRATRDVLDIAHIAKPPALPWLPDPVWRVLRIPVSRGFVWITTGMYPTSVRARLGLRWTRRDEIALRLVGRSVRAAWQLVPPSRRSHPRARAGWARARGEAASDTPLVETPARNLPPVEYRGDTRHYVPPQSADAPA
jgi:uncharacterized protein (DUF2236 family)